MGSAERIEQARPMILCQNVNKWFSTSGGERQVIRDFSLKVEENEFVVLFGPGQAGKTTILNVLAGLEPASDGTVIVNDKPVQGPSPERGMVYQKTALFPWLTVWDNVDFGPRMAKSPVKQRRQDAQYYIDLVGLEGFEKHYPIHLSGGMRQRVGIARAYCNHPVVIFMDEPFGHLDAQTRYLMEEEIERICSMERRTVIFVTNNIEEAIYLADRIVLLTDCPATVQKEYIIDLPRPRDYTNKDFLRLREEISGEMNLYQGEERAR